MRLAATTILVVEDQDAFTLHNREGLAVAGQWRGALSNGGEMLTSMRGGDLVQQFAYDDACYT